MDIFSPCAILLATASGQTWRIHGTHTRKQTYPPQPLLVKVPWLGRRVGQEQGMGWSTELLPIEFPECEQR